MNMMKELVNDKTNKAKLFNADDLTLSGIPVKFAGAGPENIKLRWSLTGIAKDKDYALDQTTWIPYNQIAKDLEEKILKYCKGTKKTTDVQPVDISFFKG